MSDPWKDATARISSMLAGNADSHEGALPEPKVMTPVETYARAFEETYGLELGITLPTALTAISGAVQGALVAPIPVPGGKTLASPLVHQFMGIAPPGGYKSVLTKDVLAIVKSAMAAGAEARTERISEQIAQDKLEASEMVGGDPSIELREKVARGGLCPSSWTDSGTPEGIRNALIKNGGHRVLMTAEPDVLREIGGYSKDGGSIGLMLRGWDQEDLVVDRVREAHLAIPAPSLPFAILVQPGTFVQYTQPDQHGFDPFISRGFFSRSWLWQTDTRNLADEYTHELVGVDTPIGGGTPGAWASLEKVCSEIARRTSTYRMLKGMALAWETEGAQLTINRPKAAAQGQLGLGEGALEEFIACQQMRLELQHAVVGAEKEETFDALVQRLTSHTMRLAGMLTLADDPDAVDIPAWAIRDAGTRLVPWLVGGWTNVLVRREEEQAKLAVSDEHKANPTLADGSQAMVVTKILLKLALHAPIGITAFTFTDIYRRAKSALPRSLRSGSAGRAVIKTGLEEALENGWVSQLADEKAAANGTKVAAYTLSDAGKKLAMDAIRGKVG